MEWRKAIPEARDRLQSRVLVWVVGLMLAVPCLWLLIRLVVLVTGISASRRYHAYPHDVWFTVMPWVVSLTFAALVWVLRAATPMAAICGGMVCLMVVSGTVRSESLLRSGLSPLILLFIFTFLASRAGKARKASLAVAEGKRGRNAAQVLANLGAAGLTIVASFFNLFDFAARGGASGLFSFSNFAGPLLMLAALCEATADTVSSEIGTAFGGRPILLTRFRRVDPGTDGAVSLMGTATGIIAAALVAAVGIWSLRLSVRDAAIAFAGGIAGLFFDSLLGATVERKGWLGNDLVNFSSTVFAVLVGLGLLAYAPHSAQVGGPWY